MKPSLLDFTKEELAQALSPSFRAKQVFKWIYQGYVDDIEAMSNLPKAMREHLGQTYDLTPLHVVREEISQDGSAKVLFQLRDGHTIESVLLPMKEEVVDEEGRRVSHPKFTICISSQVGCKIGCTFCFTAKGGFVRNLSAGEIVGQVLAIKKRHNIAPERRVNIVYMGMGEPLDNLPEVVKAVKIFADIDGLSISPKRQTISTSGLSHQIKKLGEMNLGILLAISLHAVDDALRQELMPINKAYNIASIIEAVKAFPIDERKRVMFEYLVIRGRNDDLGSAKKLVTLLHGIKAKVNLIYFNPHEGSAYQRPELKAMEAFRDYLNAHGIVCTIRQSKGLDISAACGQLKERSTHDRT
ncbi:23S rRNA (adenine(2503)-C(2))-methyltransferase RlmN [Sulfurospirillum sp. T05]|uniref:Probable dual-specificity RNA methyltransferase RlmN n=1 Tax=Sulfurospirillum tamanense TaxID=2813362 RepID=A0ABS2WQV0_9BACT|nr:23S rRNA (adenine(2503)-C(2))-methyltransferase RlmN [Sulfurospirillum tamanensis]MBN2964062.1 23S rRNA (adenine(2503)-C(2))-methyltransferase RlmN [Sulfurospirillum tamanensis]